MHQRPLLAAVFLATLSACASAPVQIKLAAPATLPAIAVASSPPPTATPQDLETETAMPNATPEPAPATAQLTEPAPETRMLFDFRDPNTVRYWQNIDDPVMGGVSSSRITQGESFAVFAGRLSLENNGGFASVRGRVAPADLTGFEKLVARVRGDGKIYVCQLRTSDAVYWLRFETRAGGWQEFALPFAEFVPTYFGAPRPNGTPLNPAAIGEYGFLIADKQEGPFSLEVAWIVAG
jgi:monofunctional biosynthetic peptidoglycan transglycosylase